MQSYTCSYGVYSLRFRKKRKLIRERNEYKSITRTTAGGKLIYSNILSKLTSFFSFLFVSSPLRVLLLILPIWTDQQTRLPFIMKQPHYYSWAVPSNSAPINLKWQDHYYVKQPCTYIHWSSSTSQGINNAYFPELVLYLHTTAVQFDNKIRQSLQN